MPFLSKVRDGRIDHLYIYINAKYKLKERTTALQTQFGLQKKILTYRAGLPERRGHLHLPLSENRRKKGALRLKRLW